MTIGGISGRGGGIQSILAMRQQIIEKSNLLQQVKAPTAAEQPAGAGPAEGFTGALKNALDSVKDTQAKSESITDAYQRGEVTDVAKVMLARQEASVAFEATLQTRNKLLSAYQDI
ncbi:MAG: flagellar hook-basal body complex protein FliE, partial [Novosphingobium sp.]